LIASKETNASSDNSHAFSGFRPFISTWILLTPTSRQLNDIKKRPIKEAYIRVFSRLGALKNEINFFQGTSYYYAAYTEKTTELGKTC